MVISNGTIANDLTFLGTQVDDALSINQSGTITAGGNKRTIRSGQRFITTESISITGAEWKALNALLLDGSTKYYYTPTVIPDLVDSSKFPMAVEISNPSKTDQYRDGVKYYVLILQFEGTSYL